MSKVPDAWDDDWVTQADKSAQAATDKPAISAAKLSKAERRAQQAAFNKQIWEEADALRTPFALQSSNDVPLQSGYQPAVKVLSRRPQQPKTAQNDGPKDLADLNIQDDEDDDDDGEASKTSRLTAEERQAKAQREREEKQRRYDEARQRLFGSSSGQSSPRQAASPGPVSSDSRSRAPREKAKSKPRGPEAADSRESRPTSTAPATPKRLYDPNDNGSRPPTFERPANVESPIIRPPRGPDGSGRGGFGFASRGRGHS